MLLRRRTFQSAFRSSWCGFTTTIQRSDVADQSAKGFRAPIDPILYPPFAVRAVPDLSPVVLTIQRSCPIRGASPRLTASSAASWTPPPIHHRSTVPGWQGSMRGGQGTPKRSQDHRRQGVVSGLRISSLPGLELTRERFRGWLS